MEDSLEAARVGFSVRLPVAVSSLSPPSTRKPVTPAATTTAVAAMIATSFVRLPPPPPCGGWGAPAGAGAPHCGCCP
ncbi:hypothetical protein SPURM210S_00988 [Streptomyces purpurascens]